MCVGRMRAFSSPIARREGGRLSTPYGGGRLGWAVPSGAKFGFPQAYAGVHAALRKIPAFSTVGIIWNSLDSLVRNEPFQWVTRDPRPIFNSCGPFPRSGRRRPRRPSIRRSTALKPLGQAETAGRAGIMAIDIARVGPGIGMKLTLSSLFGKKLSTQRPLTPRPSPPRKRVAQPRATEDVSGVMTPEDDLARRRIRLALSPPSASPRDGFASPISTRRSAPGRNASPRLPRRCRRSSHPKTICRRSRRASGRRRRPRARRRRRWTP